MANLIEALKALAALEGGDQMVAAVKAEMSALRQEAADQRLALREKESILDQVEKLTGKTGGEILGSLKEKLDSLPQLETRLTQAEQAKTIAEQAKAESEKARQLTERKILIRDAASRIGASPTVLEMLAKDLPITIGEDVLIGSPESQMPLKEFAEKDPEWSAFLPSLFPSTQEPPKPRLPTGNANGSPAPAVSAYERATGRTAANAGWIGKKK